ncbi:MAG: hypothetical protein FJX29_11105 [Alphaproteobacteria bacterium]|nr:hypothetical protein [Alphaproteobacteria bacterium]
MAFAPMRDIIRVLPAAIALWVGSRFVMDLITITPQFWTSRQRFEAFLQNGVIFVPLMVFILLLVVKRYGAGDKS